MPTLRAASGYHVSQSGQLLRIEAKKWRYIQYVDRAEELYDIVNDPHEWTNLAAKKPGVMKSVKSGYLRSTMDLRSVVGPEF